MLPLEKCKELKAAGFDQKLPRNIGESTRVAYQDENFGGICAVPEGEAIWNIMVARIPSGDELHAECVRLLNPNEWISRETTSEGSCACVIAIVEEVDEATGEKYDGQHHVYCGGQESCERNHELFRPNNSDLADLWLWLNERKKVKE